MFSTTDTTDTTDNAAGTIDQTLNAAADRIAAERAESDAQQQTRFNLGQPNNPDPFDVSDTNTNGFEAGAKAMAQFVDWQGNVLARLGLLALTGDVKADNPTLVAALYRIRNTGAPAPTIERETVAWPGGNVIPGGAFTVDIYVFTHPHEPKNQVRASEFLLAANPAITIGELIVRRIISPAE